MLSHRENDVDELLQLSVPFQIVKNDLRFRGMNYKLIKHSKVKNGSLFTDPIPDKNRPLGVTLLTVITYLCKPQITIRSDELVSSTFITKWKGCFSWLKFTHSHVVVVIWASWNEDHKLVSQIIARRLPSRVSVVLVTYGMHNAFSGSFPINLLRDIGLRAVVTSHVLVLDSDIRIPGGLHHSLLSRRAVEQSGEAAGGHNHGRSGHRADSNGVSAGRNITQHDGRTADMCRSVSLQPHQEGVQNLCALRGGIHD